MGKATKAKSRKQKTSLLPSNDDVMLDQLVTPEARVRGMYVIGTVTVTEGEFDRNTKGEQSAVINHACDPVKRWERTGELDQRQVSAIRVYQWAHRIVFGSKSISVNWSRFLASAPSHIKVILANDDHEAKEQMERIDAVLAQAPPYVADTWHNVVIDDQAAGPAGIHLKLGSEKAARAGTLLIIRLCCDLIATEMRL